MTHKAPPNSSTQAMLTIRSEQMTAFNEHALRQFVERVLRDLRKCWPDEVAELGEKETRAWIAHGIERAGAYDIITQRGMYRYINLMMMLGPDFDDDPDLPWARPILEAPELSETRKLDRLSEHALEGTDDPEDA